MEEVSLESTLMPRSNDTQGLHMSTASLALAQGDFKTASSLFEETLIFEPTNLYALMGRVRFITFRICLP